MGKLVKHLAGLPLKSDITVADVAAISASVGDVEMGLWVGANVEDALRYVEIQGAADKALGVINENNDGSTLIAGQVFQATVDFSSGLADHRTNVTYASGSAAAFSEDTVAVIIGQTFRPLPQASVDKEAEKILRVYRDTYAKKAA